MIDFSEVEKYLPRYLSKDASEKLFYELEQFPDNIDERLYSSYLTNTEIVYQGDGLRDLLFVNLPSTDSGNAPGLILSSTCDVAPENQRLQEPRVVYAAIFQLEKYKNMLIRKFVETKEKSEVTINNHIDDIKRQYISHIFYLPAGGNLEQDSIAVFDRINNLPNNYLSREDISTRRLFILSDFGFYLFLFKLSVHFTRIRENVVRTGAAG